MAYLDNTPQSSGGITDGSDINANVFVANTITSNGAVNAVSITANTIAIVDGDYDITATNASPSQATGYAITKDFNVVTTSAGHGDAVTLPAPTIGRIITIINNGAKDVGVYPSANCAIDDFGTNGIYYLASGSSQRFLGKSAAAWTRLNRGKRTIARTPAGSPTDYHINASTQVPGGWVTRDNTNCSVNLATYLPPSAYAVAGGRVGIRAYSDSNVNLFVEGAIGADERFLVTGLVASSGYLALGSVSIGTNGSVVVRIGSNAGAQQMALVSYDVEA
jgi:hypothetical protein